ncbi:MAG: hypothetical protein J5928_06340 [Firmicutes bacterium]|nr:hypothetical protein [Bacillota bacterium]
MKTKRNNRVARIAFTLLIVVALFFSLGAGYAEAASESSVISKIIAKYDALKVVADALHYEVIAEAEIEETVETVAETNVAITTVSTKTEEVAKTVEEKEEVETVAETKEENRPVESAVAVETVSTNAQEEAAKKEAEEAAAKAAAEEAARKAEEEAAAKAAAEEAARKAEEEAAAKAAAEEAARKAEEEAAAKAAAEAAAAEAEAAEAEAAVQEWSIGLPGGTMKYYTGIGYDDLCYNLQSLIDAGNIVKYNNYFAGHNPGAMGHLSGIGVGSTVRVSWGEGSYYDYTIVAHTTGSGSFADVDFAGYGNLWDIVQSGNGIVIQFCINGSNNFFLGY